MVRADELIEKDAVSPIGKRRALGLTGLRFAPPHVVKNLDSALVELPNANANHTLMLKTYSTVSVSTAARPSAVPSRFARETATMMAEMFNSGLSAQFGG